jgi:predicted RND superfamily exporter protein
MLFGGTYINMFHSTKKSWLVIIATILLTGIIGFQIPNLIIDNEVKNYVPHNLADYTTLQDADEIFGSSILLDVALYTKGPNIITAENVQTIRSITNQIEELPNVDDVQSLSNIDFLTAANGGMEARSLVPDDFTGTSEELAQLKKDIVSWEDMYSKVIINHDMKGSQIVVVINKDVDPDGMDALYSQVDNIVKSNTNHNLEINMAGDPVLSHMAREYMATDLSHLIPLVVLVVLFCLFLSFRNLEGTLLPIITVLISTTWTIGLMAVFGAHFTVVSSCLPVVLIAVGSAYGIHVLNHYYAVVQSEPGSISKDRQHEIVLETVHKMFFPVVLAGVTTIVGFISTISSPIVPLKTFAIFSAVGVTFALLLSLTFIPSMLIIKPLKGENKKIEKRLAKAKSNKKIEETTGNKVMIPDSFHETFVAHAHHFLSDNKIRVAIILIIIVGLSILGLSDLNVESAIINYFPESSELRVNAAKIDENFAGSNTFYFMVSGDEAGDLTDPEILKSMDDLSIYLSDKYPEIGKIVSFSDFIKRMNQVMNTESEEPVDEMGYSDSASGEEVSSFFGDDSSSESSEVSSFFSDDSAAESEEVSSFFSDDSSTDDGAVSSFFSDDSSDSEAYSEENDPTIVKSFGSSDMLNETATIEEFMNLLTNSYVRAGGNSSVTAAQMLDALQTELNYKGEAYNEIPSDVTKYPVADNEGLKNLISQYLLLYSGSLDQFSDDPLQPSKAKMQIQLTTHETKIVNDIIVDANAYAANNFPEGYHFQAYGIAELENALTDMITSSQLTSLLLAIGCVFIILTWYFRSPVAGIIGAIPLSLSILFNFGLMGLVGINLDMVTSLIGSIAIGIGVDYTIHFMTDYHTQWGLTHDADKATLRTLKVSGKAIAVNALSVGLGFLVLSLSQFIVLRYIGILVGVVMLTSSVTALTILPAILNIVKPKFLDKPTASDKAEKKYK